MAMQLVLKDKAMRMLFPGAPAELPTDLESLIKVQSTVMFSSGHGGGLQLSIIPDVLLASARARQFVSGDPTDLNDFYAQTIKVLDESRELARGKEIIVSRLIGLANMRVSDQIVETPFGRIRVARENDKLALPSGSDSSAQLSAVLETKSALKIVHLRTWEGGRDDDLTEQLDGLKSVFEQYHARNERNITMTRYAALLASDENLFVPVQLSQTRLRATKPHTGPELGLLRRHAFRDQYAGC